MNSFWLGFATPFAFIAAGALVFFLGMLIKHQWEEWHPSFVEGSTLGRAHVMTHFLQARRWFWLRLPGGVFILWRSTPRDAKTREEMELTWQIKSALMRVVNEEDD